MSNHLSFLQRYVTIQYTIKINNPFFFFFSTVQTNYWIQILHLHNLFSFVFLAWSKKQNKNTQKKKGKKVEFLGRKKLTHNLPASVEDTIELKVEERGMSVP